MTVNSELTPNDITTGQPWGCRYRVTKMLDKDGVPVKNLQVGQTAAGPGPVEGTAVIKTRDTEKELLELVDIDTQETHIVPYHDVWDIDTVVTSNE